MFCMRPQFRAFTSPSFVAHTGGEHVVIPCRVRVRLRVAQFDVGNRQFERAKSMSACFIMVKIRRISDFISQHQNCTLEEEGKDVK